MAGQPQDYKFEGWMGLDKNAVQGNMVWQAFTPKPFEETDVDIQITHSGICGSDIHTLRSGWGPTPYRESMGRRPCRGCREGMLTLRSRSRVRRP